MRAIFSSLPAADVLEIVPGWYTQDQKNSWRLHVSWSTWVSWLRRWRLKGPAHTFSGTKGESQVSLVQLLPPPPPLRGLINVCQLPSQILEYSSHKSRILRRPLWSLNLQFFSQVNAALKKTGSLPSQARKVRCHIYLPCNWFCFASQNPREPTWLSKALADVLANSTLPGPSSDSRSWTGRERLAYPPPPEEIHSQGEAGTGSALLVQPVHHCPSCLVLVLEAEQPWGTLWAPMVRDPPGSCWLSHSNFHWTLEKYGHWILFLGVVWWYQDEKAKIGKFRAGHTHNAWASLWSTLCLIVRLLREEHAPPTPAHLSLPWSLAFFAGSLNKSQAGWNFLSPFGN